MPPKRPRANTAVVPLCIVGDRLQVTLNVGGVTEKEMCTVMTRDAAGCVTVSFDNHHGGRPIALPTPFTVKVIVKKIKKGDKREAPLPVPCELSMNSMLVRDVYVTVQDNINFEHHRVPEGTSMAILEAYKNYIISKGPAIVKIKVDAWHDATLNFDKMRFGDQPMKVNNFH